jgi:uncharacterized protein (TIGR03083 family)
VDVWEAIREERLALADTFASLDADQWDRPSLCSEWTVRHVLGHLVVATDPPLGRVVLATTKALGRFRIANARLAVAQAERPTAELIAALRAQAGARFSPPGLGPRAPLNDILMHGLDVRVPLGLDEPRPPERYGPALDLMLGKVPISFLPRGRPRVRWVATDHDWTRGSGPHVQGRIADLLLAAGGRGARVDALTGPGQPLVADWCGA